MAHEEEQPPSKHSSGSCRTCTQILELMSELIPRYLSGSAHHPACVRCARFCSLWLCYWLDSGVHARSQGYKRWKMQVHWLRLYWWYRVILTWTMSLTSSVASPLNRDLSGLMCRDKRLKFNALIYAPPLLALLYMITKLNVSTSSATLVAHRTPLVDAGPAENWYCILVNEFSLTRVVARQSVAA